MCKAKFSFIFTLLYLQLHFSFSQSNSISFQHLSIENGLSDNSVNCIAQDKQGFIWIGTNDGLNRFDGRSVKVFRHDDNDRNSFPSNRISCAFLDSKNRLWFGGNGLIMMHPQAEKFTVFRHKKNNPHSLPTDDVTKITEDENGNIWIGTRLGLCLFDESKKSFQTFVHDTSGNNQSIYYHNRVIEIIPDKRGNLWITNIIGLYKFSLKNYSFEKYLLDKTNDESQTVNHLSYMDFDKHGKLFVSLMNQGIYTFDTASKIFSPVIFSEESFKSLAGNIEHIKCDRNGNVWFASDVKGVMQYSPLENKWTHFSHDVFDNSSLSFNKTNCIFEDASGMIWIGTQSKGIDRCNSDGEKFQSYLLQPGKSGALCADDISYFCEDKSNNLWIGTKNGLLFFDKKTESFKPFNHDEKNQNSLSDDEIFAIAEDEKNNLWIATNNGLNYFSTSTNQWKHFYQDEKDSNTISSSIIFDLVLHNNKLLLGTAAGICSFDISSGKFQNKFNNQNIGQLTKEFYLTVFEDSKKTYWISTSRSGIFHVDSNFNVIQKFRKSGGFNANNVHRFAETVDGNILMATDAGLYVWNATSDSCMRISKNDLLNIDIKSLEIANDKSIWISTSKGLMQLFINKNYEVDSIKQFTKEDGLQGDAFNNCASIKLKSGEILFGGINGFSFINQKNIRYNNFIPPVVISSFKDFDKEIKLPMMNDSLSEITLNYNQNYFTLEIAALSYNHAERNQFTYQLIGFDNAPVYNGNNNKIMFANIPPGEYVLHISASNNDGLWNNVGLKIKIKIVPPFYKTKWFYFLILLCVALILYTIYFLRIRKIKSTEKQKTEINRQLAESRMTALRAQMNPHFIFNALNSIQLFISENEKEQAMKYLSRFSRLIRLVLQSAEKNSNFISHELDLIKIYLELESLRFPGKFTFDFQIDDTINKDSTLIPAMLLQPFVENAVIHGLLNKSGNGHLSLTMKKMENKIQCIIEDDGIGRKAAMEIKSNKTQQHESLGIKVTEERMKMMQLINENKISIMVEDLFDGQKATGTKVIIEIQNKN